MSGLRAQARDLAYRHVGGTALVLIYHRVADLERDPQRLAVGRERFAAQMSMLAEEFSVVALGDLVGALGRRSVPDRAIAITFDDGYADNLLAAAPVLQQSGIPATVFVSSGYVEGGAEFWWDEIDALVLSPGHLPAHLELSAGAQSFTAALEETTTYTEPDAQAFAAWSVTDATGGERQRLYADLCEFVRPLSAALREGVLAQLREAAGVKRSVRDTHRPLNAAEVRELGATEVVEVGGHTTDHTLLAAQPLTEQQAQIEADRDRLGELLGAKPRLFSYPYGGLDSYTAETTRVVEQAGYIGSCANHPAVVKPWTDSFRIPRVLVRDVEAETLAAQIAGWFDDPR